MQRETLRLERYTEHTFKVTHQIAQSRLMIILCCFAELCRVAPKSVRARTLKTLGI